MQTAEICYADLQNASISRWVDTVEERLTQSKLPPKEARRCGLAVEDALLNWQRKLGADAQCELYCGKRLLGRKPYIRMRVKGVRADPTRPDADDPYTEWLGEYQLLQHLQVPMRWGYHGGVNELRVEPAAGERSGLPLIACMMALAVVLGLILGLLPDAPQAVVSQKLIAPVFDTLMNLLSTIAGPMIFLAVSTGIYSIGDVATVGQIGKKLILGFTAKTFLALLSTLLLVCWFFPLSLEDGGLLNIDSASAVYKLILNIVPTDIVTPFTTGNALQVIFLATACGVGILILGSRVSALVEIVNQIHNVVQLLMRAIGRLVPLFIFVSILNFFTSNDLSQLSGLGKQFALYALVLLALMAAYLLHISLKMKVSPARLLKKLMPTFLVALTTASSAAAFAENMRTCKQKLGVPEKVASFGVPLGQVLYMPAGAIAFLLSAMCIGELFGVALSPAWLFIAVVVSGILAIATPPIPGGALSCYTILFLQLGIPAAGVALAISIDLVMDFVLTAVNLFCLQTELVLRSDQLGLLERDVLRADSTKR